MAPLLPAPRFVALLRPPIRAPLRARVLWLVHLSSVLTVLGCLWAAFAFTTDTVTVKPGQNFLVGGQTWTLTGIRTGPAPDGSVHEWISTVQTPSGPRQIEVNHPAEAGDDKVLQAGASLEYRVRIEADGAETTVNLAQDTEVPLTSGGRITLVLTPSTSPTGTELLLISEKRILGRTNLTEGVPFVLGDTGLRVTLEGSAPRSTLLVRHAPGLAFLWTGLALLAASVTALMLVPRTPQKESNDA